jgi:hypothetical protein
MGALLFTLSGCEHDQFTLDHRLETFKVEVNKIQVLGTSGTTSTPSGPGFSSADTLPIPLQSIRLTVTVLAYDEQGEFMADFDRPVSFRVTPGVIKSVLSSDSALSQLQLAPMKNGMNDGEIVIEVTNVFGPVVVWVQDGPPQMPYVDPSAGTGDDEASGAAYPFAPPPEALDDPEAAPYRTYAAGASKAIYFDMPNVIEMQRMEEYTSATAQQASACASGITNCTVNNRTSAFLSNFLTIEAMKPHECLIVTAVTNAGFYVTDLSAHVADLGGDTSMRLQMEPYLRSLGHFGHLFVYNFSYPDDLLPGDCLKSVTGTVQEFSGNTQITFPSWVKNERYLTDKSLIPDPIVMEFDPAKISSQPYNAPEDLRSNGYRFCMAYVDRATRNGCVGTENMPCPTTGILDNLHLEFAHCAHNWRNFDAESLESALIKFTNVKPSNEFKNCDSNGNGVIGFFNYSGFQNDVFTGDYKWSCSPEDIVEDNSDCQCYLECAVGYDPEDPERRDRICTEVNAFDVFGQWIVAVEDTLNTRINVQTGTALPQLDPRIFDGNAYPECRLNFTGILTQTQAARPRWIVMARDSDDVCVSSAPGTCPELFAQCDQ